MKRQTSSLFSDFQETILKFPGGKFGLTEETVNRPPVGWAEKLAGLFGLDRAIAWGSQAWKHDPKEFQRYVDAGILEDTLQTALLSALDGYDLNDKEVSDYARANCDYSKQVVQVKTYTYDDGEESEDDKLRRLTGHSREELLALLPECETGSCWQLNRYPFDVEATSRVANVMVTYAWKDGRWNRKADPHTKYDGLD